MAKNIAIVFVFFFFGCIKTGVYGQSNTMASSGEATGTGGSVSYSLGQVAYITVTGSSGISTQGVQQPYEIQIVTNTKESKSTLSIEIFPNPSNDFLTLIVSDNAKKEISYSLTNLEGKVLDTQKFFNTQTTIQLGYLANGVYLVNVLENNKYVKTFKIIKTN